MRGTGVALRWLKNHVHYSCGTASAGCTPSTAAPVTVEQGRTGNPAPALRLQATVRASAPCPPSHFLTRRRSRMGAGRATRHYPSERRDPLVQHWSVYLDQNSVQLHGFMLSRCRRRRPRDVSARMTDSDDARMSCEWHVVHPHAESREGMRA